MTNLIILNVTNAHIPHFNLLCLKNINKGNIPNQLNTNAIYARILLLIIMRQMFTSGELITKLNLLCVTCVTKLLIENPLMLNIY